MLCKWLPGLKIFLRYKSDVTGCRVYLLVLMLLLSLLLLSSLKMNSKSTWKSRELEVGSDDNFPPMVATLALIFSWKKRPVSGVNRYPLPVTCCFCTDPDSPFFPSSKSEFRSAKGSPVHAGERLEIRGTAGILEYHLGHSAAERCESCW